MTLMSRYVILTSREFLCCQTAPTEAQFSVLTDQESDAEIDYVKCRIGIKGLSA